MRALFATLCFVVLAAAAGCGSSTATPDAMPPAPDAFSSICGKPGDLGNSIGVGKFCMGLGDCGTTMSAPICSVIGDQTTHFCTKTCNGTRPDGGTPECGEMAACECGTGGCGCTPTSCIGP